MFLLTEINFVCAEMRLQFLMSWVLYVDRNPKILKLCSKLCYVLVNDVQKSFYGLQNTFVIVWKG